MRVALVASLALSLMGCGALSTNSTQSAHEVAANGLFYGALALAGAGEAPRDRVATHAHIPRRAEPTHRYRCVLEGEEQTVRARSRADASAACGTGCSCADPLMSEELRLYQRRQAESAYDAY